MMNVQIPDTLAAKVAARAKVEGKQPQAIVVEILEENLKDATTPKPMTERERIREIFKEAGLLSEVSPELIKEFVKPRSKEEREAMRERLRKLSFSPTFSEMIVEDRGPR